MTATERVLKALRSGEELTTRQIESRFSVASARAIVHELRSQGYAIYMNRRTNQRGETTQKYRLGTPSRAMVATAFATKGAQQFNMSVAA